MLCTVCVRAITPLHGSMHGATMCQTGGRNGRLSGGPGDAILVQITDFDENDQKVEVIPFVFL